MLLLSSLLLLLFAFFAEASTSSNSDSNSLQLHEEEAMIPLPPLPPKKKKKPRWTDEELLAMAAADAAGPSSIAVALHELAPLPPSPLSMFSSSLFHFLHLIYHRYQQQQQALNTVDDFAQYRVASFLEDLVDYLARVLEESANVWMPQVDPEKLQSFLAQRFDQLIASLDVDPRGYSVVPREDMIAVLGLVIQVSPFLLTQTSERSALALQLRAIETEGGAGMLSYLPLLLEHVSHLSSLADHLPTERGISYLVIRIHESVFGVTGVSASEKSRGGRIKFKFPWPLHRKPTKNPALKEEKRFLKFLDVMETVLMRGLKAPQVALSFFRTFYAIARRLRWMFVRRIDSSVEFMSLEAADLEDENVLLQSDESRGDFNPSVEDDDESDEWLAQIGERLEELPFLDESDLAILSAPLEEALYDEAVCDESVMKKSVVGRVRVDPNEFPDSDDDEENEMYKSDSVPKRHRNRRRVVNFTQDFTQPSTTAPSTSSTTSTSKPSSNVQVQLELLRQLDRMGGGASNASGNLLNAALNQLTSSAGGLDPTIATSAATTTATAASNDPQLNALLRRMQENQLPALNGPSLISYAKRSSLPRLLNSLIKARFGVDVLKTLGQVLKVLNEFLGSAEVVIRAILKLIQFLRYYCLQASQFVTELGREEMNLADDHSVPIAPLPSTDVNKAAGMLANGLAALSRPSDPFHAGLQGAVRAAREQAKVLRSLPGPLLLSILHTGIRELSTSRGILRSALVKKHVTISDLEEAALQGFLRIYASIQAEDPLTAEHLLKCPASTFSTILVSFLKNCALKDRAIDAQLTALIKFLTPLLSVTGKDAQLSMLAFLLTAEEGEEMIRVMEGVPETKIYMKRLSLKLRW